MGNKPSQTFETAKRTRALQLSDQQLKKLPDPIHQLSNLRALDVSSNKLERLPDWIGNDLQTLTSLKADSNQLKSLPSSLGKLSNLDRLSLANNFLTSFNFTSVDWHSLRHVNLSHNQLTTFPLALCSPTIPLTNLDLSFNRIRQVPADVSQLQAQEVNLNNNQLTSISSTIASAPFLKVLRIESNQLTIESLPLQLFTQSLISTLAMDNNRFQARDLHQLPEYQQYIQRYTDNQKKLI